MSKPVEAWFVSTFNPKRVCRMQHDQHGKVYIRGVATVLVNGGAAELIAKAPLMEAALRAIIDAYDAGGDPVPAEILAAIEVARGVLAGEVSPEVERHRQILQGRQILQDRREEDKPWTA